MKLVNNVPLLKGTVVDGLIEVVSSGEIGIAVEASLGDTDLSAAIDRFCDLSADIANVCLDMTVNGLSFDAVEADVRLRPGVFMALDGYSFAESTLVVVERYPDILVDSLG